MPPKTDDSYTGSPISSGAIAGIVMGIFITTLLAALCLWLLCRRRRHRASLYESSANVLEIGKATSINPAGAVRSSTNSSGPPAKIREKWIGVGCVRQEATEAMDSQIIELPEPASPSELDGRISPVRQSSNVDPASVERRTTTSNGNATGSNHHGGGFERDSPVRESSESEERAHLVSSAKRSTGKAHRKLGTLRIDTSIRNHIFDGKG